MKKSRADAVMVTVQTVRPTMAIAMAAGITAMATATDASAVETAVQQERVIVIDGETGVEKKCRLICDQTLLCMCDNQSTKQRRVFVITTDGYENASYCYTYEKVCKMIAQQMRT